MRRQLWVIVDSPSQPSFRRYYRKMIVFKLWTSLHVGKDWPILLNLVPDPEAAINELAAAYSRIFILRA